MSTPNDANSVSQDATVRRQSGTTLIELIIAMAAFLLVGGAAFSLFNQQQIATTNLQSEVGLTMALRNTASLLQTDLANAGGDYFQAANVPNWPPAGITIVNNFIDPGSSCYNSTTHSYTASCFDQINIISAGGVPIQATGAAGCSDTSSGVAYGMAAPTLTLTATAANFKSGDQLLFMNSSNSKTTTVVLTQDASVSSSPSAVKFTFNPTQPNGDNINANDPLNITTCNRSDTSVQCPNPIPPNVPALPARFGVQYCSSTNDWIIKLASIQYHVAATSDPANPWQLVRTQNGIDSVVMDQIIGFKVGAAIWNADTNSGGFNVPYFNYQASSYAIGSIQEPYNFSLVRAVRVSILARTAPSSQSGGSYQVQGTAIVVNPRNLSMDDDQTQALP